MANGSNPQLFGLGLRHFVDANPDGKYLLSFNGRGDKAGVYEISIADKNGITLLPGVVTTASGLPPTSNPLFME